MEPEKMAMADSDSDCSSMDGSMKSGQQCPSSEQLQSEISCLHRENTLLKYEAERWKSKCRALQEEVKSLRQASVNIQQKAEQEEEFISNTLMKKIQILKKEKETLAMNYEQEEEYLTNDLSRKLNQLRQEKVHLEQTLEQEQEIQINKLMKKIERLEAETAAKQRNLEQLRMEKIDLENQLEAEQESLVNRLWKRMDRLEAEKRFLQEKLDQPPSAPPSPQDMASGDTTKNLADHIHRLRNEVKHLRMQLDSSQTQHSEEMAKIGKDEKHIRQENLRLQRKLQLEVERREALCRHLSESESSLEMDDERHFNESLTHHQAAAAARGRAVSSPVPYSISPGSCSGGGQPLSPGGHVMSSGYPGGTISFSPPNLPSNRCLLCNSPLYTVPASTVAAAAVVVPAGGSMQMDSNMNRARASSSSSADRLLKVAASSSGSGIQQPQLMTAVPQHTSPDQSPPHTSTL